jgi:anti-sigma B factor antagonist
MHPPQPFEIWSYALTEEVVQVHVSGEFDAATAPDLRNLLNRVIEGDGRMVVVDLRECTFVDSIALGVLLYAERALQGDGIGPALAVVTSPVVADALAKTGIDRWIPAHSSRPEAVKALSAAD